MIPRPVRRAALILLLWAFFAQTLVAATATSITIDEGLHIASGYTIWRTGDYRLVEEHPPLIKLWLSLPLLPIPDLADPSTLPAWDHAAGTTTESLPLLQMAQQLLYPYRPIDRWLVPARGMVALLGLLLVAMIYRWTRRLAPALGLLVVGFAAFDPNLIAHSAVATTDIGAALLITLSLWYGHRFLRRPNLARALATGVLLGLALASKLTALLLGPALGLAGILHLLTRRDLTRGQWVRLGAVTIFVSALSLWAVYAFQVGDVPAVPFPLPAAPHAVPLLRLQAHSSGGHQAFLLGENTYFGWWSYFPVAFLIKTPLPTLLLLIAGLLGRLVNALTNLRERTRRPNPDRRPDPTPILTHGSQQTPRTNPTATSPPSQAPPLALRILTPALLFAFIYAAVSIISPLNIGYRHLLPLLPLAYVAAAQGLSVWMAGEASRRERRSLPQMGMVLALGVLLTGQAATTVGYLPHLLGYFNLAVGGPEQGWRYLADSNTDWGQGYKALARFQETHDLGPVRLAAFIFYDPAIYGIDYEPLPPLDDDLPPVFASRLAPAPGDYVISLTPLDGVPTVDPAMYDWFRWRAPDAQIAHAFNYYRVTREETATSWVAQCTLPMTPLDDDALTAGFGQLPERRVAFDCANAWILPGGQDAHAGAYVLHGALVEDTLAARLHLAPPPLEDPFVARHLAGTDIVYRQRQYRDAPAFAVYRTQDAPQQPEHRSAWAAPAEMPISEATGRNPIPAPIALDGALTFLGATTVRTEEGLDVETWWRVTGAPDIEEPISMMGHLLTPTGEVLAVADGLGVPTDTWAPGDTLIQRHRFPTADLAEGTFLLRTGVYTLAGNQRWPIAHTDADVLLLQLSDD